MKRLATAALLAALCIPTTAVRAEQGGQRSTPSPEHDDEDFALNIAPRHPRMPAVDTEQPLDGDCPTGRPAANPPQPVPDAPPEDGPQPTI